MSVMRKLQVPKEPSFCLFVECKVASAFISDKIRHHGEIDDDNGETYWVHRYNKTQ